MCFIQCFQFKAFHIVSKYYYLILFEYIQQYSTIHLLETSIKLPPFALAILSGFTPFNFSIAWHITPLCLHLTAQLVDPFGPVLSKRRPKTCQAKTSIAPCLGDHSLGFLKPLMPVLRNAMTLRPFNRHFERLKHLKGESLNGRYCIFGGSRTLTLLHGSFQNVIIKDELKSIHMIILK